jgi:FAD:protein FMN transferase
MNDWAFETRCGRNDPVTPRVHRWVGMRFALVIVANMCASFAPMATAQPAKDKEPSELVGYSLTFPAMGTTVTIDGYAVSEQVARGAFEEAKSLVQSLSEQLSDYNDESEVAALHRAWGSGESIEVSEPLWDVIVASDRWHVQSAGAFDASVGAVTRLWRKARRQKRIPAESSIAEAVTHVGWTKLELVQATKHVRSQDPQLRLDFGAIAKGYIIDRAFETLRDHQIHRCVVNAGGDLRCGDPPPDRAGWPIEISPLKDGDMPRRFELCNAAIATSGDLFQSIEYAGAQRSHIIDPRSGLGVPGPQSVSVIAPTAIDADAAATAVSVMGTEVGFALIRSLDGFEAVLARADGTNLRTDAFPEWELTAIKP